jgi:TonB-dependent starch-binding outer membrane protein SusC
MIKSIFKKAMFIVVLLSIGNILFAQQKTVTGTVTNAEGQPLDKVSVGIKGATTIAQTNSNGVYSIVVPSNQSVIKISSIGYGYQELLVGNRTTINVVLEKELKAEDEAIVVGYTKKAKINIQGAVSTIKGSEIEDLPVANLGSALINRLPGVSVNFASGKPGSTTDINIRNSIVFPGTASGAANQPLYVIDGIIVNPTVWAQSGNPDFFENLDASQIEDITILRDASAAIYGAAGAKGVVLITTKKGKPGKPRITYSGSYGISDQAVKTNTLSAYEHAKILNDGFELNNRPIGERFSAADLEKLKTTPNKSWFDEFWHTGNVMRHTLNVSGGSDKVTFFSGGSYYQEDGNIGDINIKKYSIRTGMEAKITDGLTASFQASTDFNNENRNTHRSQTNTDAEDQTTRALFLTPKWVPTQINGIPTGYGGSTAPGGSANLWSMLGTFNSGNYARDESQGLSVNASLEYKPKFLKGLTARVQFGKLNRNSTTKSYNPKYNIGNFARVGQNGLLFADTLNPALPPFQTITQQNIDRLSEGATVSSSYQLFATLGYNKSIGKHSFSALVGADQSEANSRNTFITKTQQLVAGVDEFWAFSNDLSIIASITDIFRNPQYTQFAKRSYFSRADYSLDNKYFFEFVGRFDASSNFSPDNRWGFFPTVGLGWKISDEKFMEKINFINFLKLRATYGIVGEDRVANKTYVNRFSQTQGYLFGTNNVFTNGLDPNLYPNPDATWEKARTFNFGFDATVYKNKFNLSADFYQRYVWDGFNQLDASNLPITTGLPSAVENYGQALAWGAEFALGYRTKINRNWGFNTDVNFGWSNSQILQQYTNPANLGLYGNNTVSGFPVGKDPRKYNGNNYGYIATGIIRTQADVDAILAKNPNYTIGGQKPQIGFMDFKDVNNDGKIDDGDITTMFDRTTSVIGFGITFGLSYKQFKLQTNLNLSLGGKRFYDSEARKQPTTTQNAPAFWADTYSLDNPNGKYPRADAPLARENSTFWAVNGTSSRINNMVLSWSMPKNIAAKYKIPDLRINLSGTNLWTLINPLKYKDPYTGNFAAYPMIRTINLGVNMGL